MDNKTLSTAKNLLVIYEDNHLIAINKRPGDIVQGDKTGDVPLSDVVKEYIKIKYNKPGNVYLGVAHRLDRPTSGIVVFAKTSKALPRLNKLLTEDEISWLSLPKSQRFSAIILATIQDHFDADSTKLQIVNNIQALNYGNLENNEIARSYIK